MKDIPQLPGGGVLGHVDEFRANLLNLLVRTWRELGDIARFRVLNRWIVTVHDTDAIHEVLVTRARDFAKSYALRVTFRPLLGEGLVTSEGAFWRHQRKAIAPLFATEQVHRYADLMAECAFRAIADWKDGQTLDVFDETMKIALNVVSRSLLGVQSWDESEQIGAAMDEVQERFMSKLTSCPLPTWVPTPANRRLTRALGVLEDKITGIITDRRASPEREQPDVLTLLLGTPDEVEGNVMTDEQLRDEVMTMYVAGHETMASALAWTIHELVKNPTVYERLQEEVKPLGLRPLTAADLPSLRYTTCVFKESLRLHPPAYVIGREAADDTEIGGYPIPAGTNVIMSPYVQHRRHDLFPNPEQFDPDRFASGEPPKYHYIPFGAGPRVCIGQGFALAEGPLVLATLAQHARFEAEDGGNRPKQDPLVTLRPQGLALKVRLLS